MEPAQSWTIATALAQSSFYPATSTSLRLPASASPIIPGASVVFLLLKDKLWFLRFPAIKMIQLKPTANALIQLWMDLFNRLATAISYIRARPIIWEILHQPETAALAMVLLADAASLSLPWIQQLRRSAWLTRPDLNALVAMVPLTLPQGSSIKTAPALLSQEISQFSTTLTMVLLRISASAETWITALAALEIELSPQSPQYAMLLTQPPQWHFQGANASPGSMELSPATARELPDLLRPTTTTWLSLIATASLLLIDLVEVEHLSNAHAAEPPLKLLPQHQYAQLTHLLSNAHASTSMMPEAARDTTAIATIRPFSGSERSTSPSILSAAAAILTLSSSHASAVSQSSSTVTPLFLSATPMQPQFLHVWLPMSLEPSEGTARLLSTSGELTLHSH